MSPRPPPGDAPETSDDPGPVRSRTDLRKERLAFEEGLLALAGSLVAASPAVLQRLELSGSVLEAVAAARRTRPGAARNRALRLVRAALRDDDPALVQERFDAVHAPRRPKAPPGPETR